MYNITVLPGDGVGPEVVKESIKVLKALADKSGKEFTFHYGLVGGDAYEKKGVPLPEETIDLCEKFPYIIFGAVGGPKWDNLPFDKRPEKAILGLRKSLDLFANLRPAVLFEPLKDSSPLSEKVLKNGLDLMVVRELTGGIYFGEPRGRKETDNGIKAYDTMVYSTYEIERIGKIAFEISRKRNKKVTSVDKSNVLENSRLWREVVNNISLNYTDIILEHQYVDNCAMQIVNNPSQYDVILTGNMFGDILSDEASMLTGSIGMLPSASVGEGETALYEPIHGSAPDIAGKNKANPIATILSGAMLLKYSLKMEKESKAIELAVNKVLEKGYRTKDLYDENKEELIELTTEEIGDKIVEELYNINI